MSDYVISLFIAAGAAAWMYTKMGQRLGYGNTQNVWTMVAIIFAVVFIAMTVLLKFVVHLH